MAGHDLSGRWTGVYFYPSDPVHNPFDDYPPTPFTAELRDAAGVVTGAASEPDLLYGAAVEIPSIIDGSHDGSSLRFAKFSEAAEGFDHPIDYEGSISSDGLSIEGRWSILGDWSGTFRIQRESGVEESRTVEAADSITR